MCCTKFSKGRKNRRDEKIVNTIKNLYIVFYTDNAHYPNQGKIVKVFTDSEPARKY